MNKVLELRIVSGSDQEIFQKKGGGGEMKSRNMKFQQIHIYKYWKCTRNVSLFFLNFLHLSCVFHYIFILSFLLIQRGRGLQPPASASA